MSECPWNSSTRPLSTETPLSSRFLSLFDTRSQDERPAASTPSSDITFRSATRYVGPRRSARLPRRVDTLFRACRANDAALHAAGHRSTRAGHARDPRRESAALFTPPRRVIPKPITRSQLVGSEKSEASLKTALSIRLFVFRRLYSPLIRFVFSKAGVERKHRAPSWRVSPAGEKRRQEKRAVRSRNTRSHWQSDGYLPPALLHFFVERVFSLSPRVRLLPVRRPLSKMPWRRCCAAGISAHFPAEVPLRFVVFFFIALLDSHSKRATGAPTKSE